MRGFERVGHLHADVEEFVGGERPAGEAMLEGLPFEQFHGDEGAALVLVHIVDGAYVGVIQGGGGEGFALEALDGLRVGGDILRQELQGHAAAEARIFSAEDDAHAAAAEFLQDAIVRAGHSDEKVMLLRIYLVSEEGLRE